MLGLQRSHGPNLGPIRPTSEAGSDLTLDGEDIQLASCSEPHDYDEASQTLHLSPGSGDAAAQPCTVQLHDHESGTDHVDVQQFLASRASPKPASSRRAHAEE